MENEVVNTQNHEIAKYLAGQLLKVVLITVFFLSFPISSYIRGYADFTQMPTLALLSNHNYAVGLGMGVAGCFFFLISMIDFIADCLKLFFAKDKNAQLKEILATDDKKEVLAPDNKKKQTSKRLDLVDDMLNFVVYGILGCFLGFVLVAICVYFGFIANMLAVFSLTFFGVLLPLLFKIFIMLLIVRFVISRLDKKAELADKAT